MSHEQTITLIVTNIFFFIEKCVKIKSQYCNTHEYNIKIIGSPIYQKTLVL